MESSEKILNNFDVLQLIFHYLHFTEHLKLIQICPQFKEAIVHGVWRWMYKNLNIRQSSTRGNFVLQYNAENNVKTEHSLTSEELHIILHHSSMYIRKLELYYIRRLENTTSFNYHRLTELLISDTNVGDTHLQQVAKNCINLQSLRLSDITKYGSYESNIRVNVFDKMKALNRLEIDDIFFTAWNYFDVQQLFCLPHLKTLIINMDKGARNDSRGSYYNSTDRVYNIENLTIGLPFLYMPFENICFENLTKLSISLHPEDIDDNVLTQINNACPKLSELSITESSVSFKEFPRMKNLMHLTFKGCRNIKFKHFYEIFRKLKLKSLSIKDVQMRCELEDIFYYNCISNTLETLYIQDVLDRRIVQKFFKRQHQFENVSKIRLATGCNKKRSMELCFSHNFPYLQELVLDFYYISSEDILHLKDLKVLKFNIFDNMSWSYLKILLRHPTLTHITITPTDRQDFEMRYKHLPNCCEGLTTKLEYLCLPYKVYESTLNFWPDFLQRNILLELKIVDEDGYPRRV